MTRRHWYTIVLVVVTLLWLSAELRVRQLKSEIKRVYVNEVTLRAIDADTSEPLRGISIGGLSSSMTEHPWPSFSVMAVDEGRAIGLRWMHVEPLGIEVSLDSFTPQIVMIDRDSGRELTVQLKRAPAVR